MYSLQLGIGENTLELPINILSRYPMNHVLFILYGIWEATMYARMKVVRTNALHALLNTEVVGDNK